MKDFFQSFVIQSEAKNLVYNHVYVSEIFRTESSTTRLPPFGRLNDKTWILNILVIQSEAKKDVCHHAKRLSKSNVIQSEAKNLEYIK